MCVCMHTSVGSSCFGDSCQGSRTEEQDRGIAAGNDKKHSNTGCKTHVRMVFFRSKFAFTPIRLSLPPQGTQSLTLKHNTVGQWRNWCQGSRGENSDETYGVCCVFGPLSEAAAIERGCCSWRRGVWICGHVVHMCIACVICSTCARRSFGEEDEREWMKLFSFPAAALHLARGSLRKRAGESTTGVFERKANPAADGQ